MIHCACTGRVKYYNKYASCQLVIHFDTQYVHNIAQTVLKAQVICQVSPSPSHGPPWGVSYTCSNPGNIVVWSGEVLKGNYIIVQALLNNTSPSLTISGVYAIENHSGDLTFINSILTFTGFNLYAINGLALSCGYHNYTTVSIMIPSRF